GVGLFLTAPDGEVRSVERPVYQGVFALPLELPPGTGGRFNLALGVLREEQYQLGESYELYTTPSELALHVDVPYPPNAFSNVLLDEWLPSRFQSGEGLLLRGSVSQPAREVVLFFDRLGQQYSYRAPVQDGRFQLEAELEAPPGQYQLGLSLDRRESILYPVVVE
ncbi:MAG: hypothetical protein HY335_01315, partial [Deinococcus sp.]|nr:hypothetical protein [Deinococcus sp.]